MKLLILSHNPSRASFRQRIGEYMPLLEKQGIKTQLNQLPKNILTRWKLFKSAETFDVVLLHKKCLNFCDSLILRKYAKKIIYDFDDAIMYSPHHPEKNHTSHYRLFRRTAKMADSIIAGNEYLAGHARKFCPAVHVLPTGLDLSQFAAVNADKPDNNIRIVWIGSKATLEYLEELKAVLEEIGKEKPNTILRIIADNFFDLDNMAVEKKQWSLQTQATDLSACDIGLAPLPDDRFTRGKCGFKILQYFAAGLPVVASPVGVNLDFIHQSSAGISAITPAQWKAAIIKLIENPQLRKSMGQNGRQFVRQFDNQTIGQKFCEIINSNLLKRSV